MKEIQISANDLVRKLLHLSKSETVCFLDSCGINHLGSHLLIAGIKPVEVLEISDGNPSQQLDVFNKSLSENYASIFTISYDFAFKLEKSFDVKPKNSNNFEPDISLTKFDCLIVHNYTSHQTFIQGNEEKFEQIEKLIEKEDKYPIASNTKDETLVTSNFTRSQYLQKVTEIQELIRKGETYQTNLTQQFTAELPNTLTPQQIFWNLRKNHPAAFASFIKRKNDFVVSISPERFVHIDNQEKRKIRTSPIKGTRPRGKSKSEDLLRKNELLTSQKDRAENTMIVDLLRNDLGRICEFGSVIVEKLCDLEEHPSLFHLVSTVSGNLRNDVNFSDVIEAIFPCGSITGCPKIRTMQIIDELETVNRGLSMGAIGYCGFDKSFDLNVAIRTMVINKQKAVFNVGGGIVIDSNPIDEYEESLTKAKAIFSAIGIKDF